MNTSSIVMWVILVHKASWDCFKTPILREILRTQNLLRIYRSSGFSLRLLSLLSQTSPLPSPCALLTSCILETMAAGPQQEPPSLCESDPTLFPASPTDCALHYGLVASLGRFHPTPSRVCDRWLSHFSSVASSQDTITPWTSSTSSHLTSSI